MLLHSVDVPVLKAYAFDAFFMGFDHLCHRIEAELVAWHFGGYVSGAVAFFAMTAIDPCRRQPGFVCRNMVVIQALCGVQNVLLLDAGLFQGFDHKGKVVRVRFVRANILRGDDVIKLDAQLGVAQLEFIAIDVRQNHQLVVLFQVAQRFNRVRERGPVLDGGTEFFTLLGNRLQAPLFSDTVVHRTQNVLVQGARRFSLLRRLVTAEHFQQLVVGEGFASASGKRFKCVDDAGFPVDQGAVAIKRQRFIVRYLHLSFLLYWLRWWRRIS